MESHLQFWAREKLCKLKSTFSDLHDDKRKNKIHRTESRFPLLREKGFVLFIYSTMERRHVNAKAPASSQFHSLSSLDKFSFHFLYYSRSEHPPDMSISQRFFLSMENRKKNSARMSRNNSITGNTKTDDEKDLELSQPNANCDAKWFNQFWMRRRNGRVGGSSDISLEIPANRFVARTMSVRTLGFVVLFTLSTRHGSTDTGTLSVVCDEEIFFDNFCVHSSIFQTSRRCVGALGWPPSHPNSPSLFFC